MKLNKNMKLNKLFLVMTFLLLLVILVGCNVEKKTTEGSEVSGTVDTNIVGNTAPSSGLNVADFQKNSLVTIKNSRRYLIDRITHSLSASKSEKLLFRFISDNYLIFDKKIGLKSFLDSFLKDADKLIDKDSKLSDDLLFLKSVAYLFNSDRADPPLSYTLAINQLKELSHSKGFINDVDLLMAGPELNLLWYNLGFPKKIKTRIASLYLLESIANERTKDSKDVAFYCNSLLKEESTYDFTSKCIYDKILLSSNNQEKLDLGFEIIDRFNQSSYYNKVLCYILTLNNKIEDSNKKNNNIKAIKPIKDVSEETYNKLTGILDKLTNENEYTSEIKMCSDGSPILWNKRQLSVFIFEMNNYKKSQIKEALRSWQRASNSRFIFSFNSDSRNIVESSGSDITISLQNSGRDSRTKILPSKFSENVIGRAELSLNSNLNGADFLVQSKKQVGLALGLIPSFKADSVLKNSVDITSSDKKTLDLLYG